MTIIPASRRAIKYRPVPAGWIPTWSPAEKLSVSFKFAAALLFGGIYTAIDYNLKGGTIPMVSALPGLLLLLRKPRIVSARFARFVLIPSMLITVFAILAPSLSTVYLSRIASIAQVGYSMALAYVANYVLQRLGAVRLHRLLGYMVPIYLVLIAAEAVLRPIQHLMESYQSLVYQSDIDFDSIQVRESLMGGYRPKLFTSEASFVAISILLMITAYLWSGRGTRRYFLALSYAAVGLVIVRSPIVLFLFPIIFTTAMTDSALAKYRANLAIGLTLVTGIVVLLAATVGQKIVGTRLEAASNGVDYSTTFRTYGALEVAYEVVQKYPLFGSGPGGFDLVKNEIVATELRLGVPVSAVEHAWRMSIGNAPASLLVSFGLVGFVVGIWLLIVFVNGDTSRPRAPVYMAIACWSMSYAAVYTPKFLVTLILLVTVAKLRDQRVVAPVARPSLRNLPRSAIPKGRPVRVPDRGAARS